MKIPKERQLLYLLFLGALIPLLAFGYIVKERKTAELTSQRLAIAYQEGLVKHQRQFLNNRVREVFASADPHYVDNQIGSMRLLKAETASLAKLLEQDPAIPSKELARRIHFLKGVSNKLTFTQGVVESFAGIKERQEMLAHPVEVDAEDIKELLASIEGRSIGAYGPKLNRPQLIVKDFSIKRRESESAGELFLLDLKLIEREIE